MDFVARRSRPKRGARCYFQLQRAMGFSQVRTTQAC